jgi:ABC-2 type transport system ATP-binding protein
MRFLGWQQSLARGGRWMSKTMISTRELSKTYGRKGQVIALDKLNLEVYERETFGLLGPNGAGKTTTVRLLNCIVKPTGGRATVGGHDLVKGSLEIKRMTGLLAESPGLYEKLSAHEFLQFMGALYDVPDDVLDTRTDKLLRLFGLHSRRNHLLEGYSRGMKQKVLIAAALIHDPPLLFFDEPTSTLDPNAALMVKDLMKDLAENAGKTIVVCSHILPIIEELCDRIGIINRGELVAVGTLDELLAKTGKDTLEKAYIDITGGVQQKELLSWRELGSAKA